MSEYFFINVLIIAFPLIFSFDKRINYYKKFRNLFFSILTVGTSFVVWDSLVTARGDWAFNKAYTFGIEIINLPIEEILFFITVPFSCIFIFEALNYFFKDEKLKINKKIFTIPAALFFLFSGYFSHLEYTSLVFFICGATILFLNRFSDLFNSKNYWSYIGITFVLFFIFNYILTSLPIVTYNPNAILNIRILTIPIEDFFYNFAMLSLYLYAFTFSKIKN